MACSDPHPVQGIRIRFSSSFFTFLNRESSAVVREAGNPVLAVSTFWRTCSGVDMPERTTVTSGWFQTQRSAQPGRMVVSLCLLPDP